MTLILNATEAEIARVMNAIAIIVVYFLWFIIFVSCDLFEILCFSHCKDSFFFIILQVFSPLLGSVIATR